MRKATYLLAAAAISGLALAATSSSAGPLAPGLIGTNPPVPEITSGLLEKAYYKKHKKHRYYYHHRRHHHRRYYLNDYYYDNNYYYPYSSCDPYFEYCGYSYPSYGFFPFLGFGIGFGGHHHHHHHHNW